MKLIHEIPGRMRFEVPRLRRSENAAEQLRREMADHAPLWTVQVNTLTGSVLVGYDPRRSGRDEVVASLEAALPGIEAASCRAAGPSQPPSTDSGLADEIATAFRRAALERLMQFAVAALV